MQTKILPATLTNIAFCAKKIADGEVVAFPTETVYGLGADALNESAVKKIFEIKGRPADNPLIVHVASADGINSVAASVPPESGALIKKFMPGPLTLIFDKNKSVPAVTTGGLGTVAVRMPSNKTALRLIELSGRVIAAPSANSSTKPSPTTAKHVFDDLNGKVEYILDGGECDIGLESTVLDVRGGAFKVLRLGGTTVEALQAVINKEPVFSSSDSRPLSPGQKYKHYSPNADVYFSSFYPKMNDVIKIKYDDLASVNKKPVIICLDGGADFFEKRNIITVGKDENGYARNLFSALRKADELGYDTVLAQGVSPSGMGAAVISRLLKASSGKII